MNNIYDQLSVLVYICFDFLFENWNFNLFCLFFFSFYVYMVDKGFIYFINLPYPTISVD